MMDYYGSIIKSESDIDNILIQRFRDRCYESLMKQIISDLRRENILHKEYSVSGWNIFHSKPIYDIIEKRIKVQKTKQRLKFLYIYNQSYSEINICKMICENV